MRPPQPGNANLPIGARHNRNRPAERITNVNLSEGYLAIEIKGDDQFLKGPVMTRHTVISAGGRYKHGTGPLRKTLAA